MQANQCAPVYAEEALIKLNAGLRALNQDPFDPTDPYRWFRSGRTPTEPELRAVLAECKTNTIVYVYQGVAAPAYGRVVRVYPDTRNIWASFAVVEFTNGLHDDVALTAIKPSKQ